MVNAEQLLTKQEIADQSGVKIGRVKYYIKNFPDYFEEHKLDGKPHPMYDPEAVEKVQLISDLVADRKSHTEIEKELEAAGYSPVITMVEARAKFDGEASTIAGQLPSQLVATENLVNALSVMNRVADELGRVIKHQEEQIKDRDDTIERLENELSEKNQTIEELQDQLKKKRGK